MLTIGVYDSGIGGLTTLSRLIKSFGGQKFVYFADNLNMPFGTKNDDKLKPILQNSLEKLKNLSDLQVIACNTASVLLKPRDVFTLQPRIENYSPTSTLLIATPSTIRNSEADDKGYLTADTKDLATLVEIAANLCYKKRDFDFRLLHEYLESKLRKFHDVSDILIGCSHYVYLNDEIKSILKNANLDDGNEYVVEGLKPLIKFMDGKPDIKFVFSGQNEENKYEWLLSNLIYEQK